MDDLIDILISLLTSDMRGSVNLTAPNPERQRDFAKKLGRALHRPAFFPAPAFALKAALGGFSTELLSSKRVVPKMLLDAGFVFKYPTLEGALASLFDRD